MNWGSFDAFVHMGDYGLFVWGSYGATFGALALEVWLLHRRWQRARAAAAAEHSRSS
jgi:heme exporter protein D